MRTTPKSMRMHIGLFGRRNVGKSSLMNALLGFPKSIVSDVAGTTTDPVEKAMEFPPLGPVVFVDTAGIDDVGALGALRVKRSREILERMDVAVVICDEAGIGPFERGLIAELQAHKTPILCIFNKCDRGEPSLEDARALLGETGEAVRISVKTGRNLDAVRESLIRIAPEDRFAEPPMVSDLVPAGGSVVLVVPIDLGAPKGRLILPQVQAIREILDADASCTVVKERELIGALANARTPPSLVICDSQIVLKAAADTPPDIPLTTFSILMARLKADLVRLAEGAAVLHRLKPGDHVLVAEACTHDVICDDIGRVKIPRWLRQFAGGDLRIDFSGGKHFPEDLAKYKLIIQCGACMVTRKHMLSWLYRAERQGVPMTNYGVAISVVQGVLERSLEPFPEAYRAYEAALRMEPEEA